MAQHHLERVDAEVENHPPSHWKDSHNIGGPSAFEGSKGPTFPKVHGLFLVDRALFVERASAAKLSEPFARESTMQRTFAIILSTTLLAMTTAAAQTNAQFSGQSSGASGTVASDPLTIPASPLPSSTPGSGAGTSGSSAERTGGGATSASSDPEIPLQLPGEASDTSTQTANTTASGSAAGGGSASSTSCGPQVPSTDGGSANITEIAGGLSLNGC